MNHRVSIYGAQLLAETIYTAMKSTYKTEVSYFIVTERKGNPEQLDGIEVLTLSEYLEKNIREQILIAVPEEHHRTITDELENYGITDYVCLTSQLRNQILRKYYNRIDGFTTLDGVSNLTISDHPDLEKLFKIYMVRSSRDRLQENKYALSEQIEQIQAGAVLDNGSLGILRDDTGDNISAKNRDYCELTALYWIWKNSAYEYAGLCHYRRVFELSGSEIQRIIQSKVDVILPYPTIHFPDISAQYIRYLSKNEWELMRKAILMKSPELQASWQSIWKGRFFYNYNMLIARQEVLHSYCEWVFDILDIVEQLCREEGIIPSKRYAGYMGEIFATIYFLHYKKDYKIINAGVDILI